MNKDFSDLLAAFARFEVRYLVVGGYAVMEYGEPRYTKDLDVWILTDRANAARVFEALKEFGAPLTGITPEDFTKAGLVYQIGVAPVRIDILMSIDGVEFGDAWERRVQREWMGSQVSFISREDLIKNKLASGRPQDLADAAALRLQEEGS